jgi:opacity protein-like surface antigen
MKIPRLDIVLSTSTIFVLALSVPSAARAQTDELERRIPRERFKISAAILAGVPVGEFAEHVESGVGAGLSGTYFVAGPLGLRFETSWLFYGSTSQMRPFEQAYQLVPDRKLERFKESSEVSISNHLMSFLLGPELSSRIGSVTGHVAAGVGFTVFFTESTAILEDFYYDEDEGTLKDLSVSHFNHGHATPAWSVGGGLAIDLMEYLRLTFSGRYLHHGQAEYWNKGSVRSGAGASQLVFSPVKSSANLMIWEIGVSIPID